MSYLKSFCIVIIACIAMSSGCNKSEELKPNQCIEATVIAADCPGIVFVQVNNAPIGSQWKLKHAYNLYDSKTYSNAISINNLHLFTRLDELKPNDKIWFRIDEEASKNPSECINPSMVCTAELRFESYPEKAYCVKSIAMGKCEGNQE
jgi:hypothetical protein